MNESFLCSETWLSKSSHERILNITTYWTTQLKQQPSSYFRFDVLMSGQKLYLGRDQFPYSVMRN